ncbi:MAG: alpha-L-fucosidase [Marinilabiliaceae bacterium]|nr:alpha-L-fucosidase [Marinilabiliaceae bacterium]
MRKINILYVLLFISALHFLGCQQNQSNESADKMEWWREAKFGMFIHFGLYSIPAGEYNGEQIPGYSEWLMELARIPVIDYKQYANQFNPKNFDAEAWVKMAKDAGMKYIVITSKHHDGFALFDSKVSDFDVMSTPFKRDIIKELADACKKLDMPFGLYYSQAQDWTTAGNISGSVWDSLQVGDHDNYLDEKSVPQVEEILNNYGDIKILWWDTPGPTTAEQAAKFYEITDMFPHLIQNDRLIEWGDDGDLITPEQHIPEGGYPGQDWETCMTMNESWGYKKVDTNWKSSTELVHHLINIASMGGNFLLNIGPKPDGTFPQPNVQTLNDMGKWMAINGEAIYGTKASPVNPLDWGKCTKKVEDDHTKLYFHVFDFPANGKLFVPGFKGEVKKAYALTDNDQKISTSILGDNLLLDIAGVDEQKHATVVVVEIKGDIAKTRGPVILYEYDHFLGEASFSVEQNNPEIEIRYTVDGSYPTLKSPIADGEITVKADESFTVFALQFVDGKPVGAITTKKFICHKLSEPVKITEKLKPGLTYQYFEGSWNMLPDFDVATPKNTGTTQAIDLEMRNRDDRFGLTYDGYFKANESGLYKFILSSDDGTRLHIGDQVFVNDGIHGLKEHTFFIALKKGMHELHIDYFEGMGGQDIIVKASLLDQDPQVLTNKNLYH